MGDTFVSVAAMLINLFILQSCGAKYHIEGDLLEEIDVDNVVLALVNLSRKVFSLFLML